jgi:DNA-binding MarR family transcriptional regulator
VSEASVKPSFLPQIVTQAFSQLMGDLHQHLVETGHADLRPTHCLNVFRFMDCDGTRPTTLARRAGMTPQAMSELVGYLEQRDYVRRVPDPTDGRGRVVVYADRGTHAAEIATSFFADMETRWGALVGPDRLRDVKSALTEILDASPSHGAVTAKTPAL